MFALKQNYLQIVVFVILFLYELNSRMSRLVLKVKYIKQPIRSIYTTYGDAIRVLYCIYSLNDIDLTVFGLTRCRVELYLELPGYWPGKAKSAANALFDLLLLLLRWGWPAFDRGRYRSVMNMSTRSCWRGHVLHRSRFMRWQK